MAKNLLIVESPAKAKTIEKILGKDFVVKSSFGHVRDLAKKDMGIDVEGNYTPNYEISADKKKVVSELKKLAKDAEVWLATDEDREGEAISWHLLEVLNLDPATTKRIVFHEITPTAIKKAVANPRTVNIDLVNAQQARRILDRLVGFELSPLLWKKISMRNSLSAGRVQSVAVRLLVEREREIIGFDPQAYFKVTAEFDVDGTTLKADLGKRFDTEAEATSFLEACASAGFSVKDIQVKPSKRKPAPPFTTSTLQQEASRKLGYSVARTMSVAQRLYENGHITYMRTDSVNLSDLALNTAKKVITEEYGAEYSKTRKYTTKKAGAQEAHEAIRPTYINNITIEAERDQQRLYELIWKRTVASQMAEAELEKTTIKIDVSNRDEDFSANGEVIKFDGFLKLYIVSKDEEDTEDDNTQGLLPPVSIGQTLGLLTASGFQKFTNPPYRFTEASLVKKLEELGIGRPSTYAPTINTIQKRGYVVKENRDGQKRKAIQLHLNNGQVERSEPLETFGTERNKLFPTDLGMVVTDFLKQHFTNIMDYSFTANIEAQFDKIADGEKEWVATVDNFYKPFHEKLKDTEATAERATGERVLGTDPDSGREVLVRIGKFGPMVQIGRVDEEEKPRFASLLPDQHLETITFEEAMELFKLPRVLGKSDKGEDIKANIGRYGPYVQLGKTFASIPEDKNPHSITLEEAVVLIKDKLEAAAKNTIASFNEGEIQILNGRYGPYIKQGKRNFKIPKDRKPEELTLEDCQEIIENAPPPRRGRGRK
ncbi:MAG: type I DNA topoisomerase [Saprospiraceae bacterium]|nr:type I DNA topoisomerase [Saprospiraceae bacterium]